jgi:hypothetical protein
MFSWIPILGPLIDGIVRIFSGFTDTKIATIKANAEISKELARTVQVYHDDPGFKLSRDIVLFPAAIWTSLVTWDNIVIHHWPSLVWTVEKYPPGLEFFPYAVLTALLGINLMNIWKH